MSEVAFKDTKILIPEIPGEWTRRMRSGHTNVWNGTWYTSRDEDPRPEVRLEPPARGLYAERIDGAWYWVCGCEKCLGNEGKHSYITCYEHDRCELCHVHREQITETPWGWNGGWACEPCVSAEKARRKTEALAAAAAAGHDRWACMNQDEVVCPYCASKHEAYFESDSDAARIQTCDVCDGKYTVEVEYSPSYTTKKVVSQESDA